MVRAEVPFGDTFLMHSKWVLRPAPAAHGGSTAACELEISYEVRFIKHNLLAPIIESANLREARSTFQQLRPIICKTVAPTMVVES